MKRAGFLFVFFLIAGTARQAFAADTIVVKKDPRLDILVSKQATNNKRSQVAAGTFRGFRLQVLSTANRNTAFDTKAMLESNFPDQKSYITYQSPNFRVRIGNFLKREDADNFRSQLLRFFPNGSYIVEDTIEYVPPDEEDPMFQ
ncbi:MAG: SPOR domain-containing protein [Chitinophagaceae bacterium]|nr:SPOR domain-containing protein [Chitinophagaceae bacterium]